jgi:hypothetical protein
MIMNMIKRILVLSLTATLMCLAVTAQDTEIPTKEKQGFDSERLFFGGNFGLTFGDFTFVNVSPQVGYRFTPIFSAGTGLNFIYQSSKIYYPGNQETKSQYGYAGLNIFGRVNPLKFIVLNVQPELNYVWGSTKYYPSGPEIKQDGKFIPSLLLGGGVVIPSGGRGSMMAMLQYDVIQDPLSPYGSSMFFSFGFNF